VRLCDAVVGAHIGPVRTVLGRVAAGCPLRNGSKQLSAGASSVIAYYNAAQEGIEAGRAGCSLEPVGAGCLVLDGERATCGEGDGEDPVATPSLTPLAGWAATGRTPVPG
jgi:hypothetical protein